MGQTAIPNIRSGSCKRSVSVSTTNLGMWGTAAVGCRVLTIHGLELTLAVSKYITREYSREVNMLDRRRRREVGRQKHLIFMPSPPTPFKHPAHTINHDQFFQYTLGQSVDGSQNVSNC